MTPDATPEAQTGNAISATTTFDLSVKPWKDDEPYTRQTFLRDLTKVTVRQGERSEPDAPESS
jgi:hypothetical protein